MKKSVKKVGIIKKIEKKSKIIRKKRSFFYNKYNIYVWKNIKEKLKNQM